MKKALLFFIIFTSMSAFAQVGVNTNSPKATLDLVAKDAKSTTVTTPAGVLVPRVSRLRAFNMSNVENSTIIYVDDISDGQAIGATAEVNKIGFYFYKGGKWNKITNVSNIYNTDGVLTENRTIKLEDKTLTFKGTAAEFFTLERSNTGTNSAPYLALKRNNSSEVDKDIAVASGQALGALTFSGNSGSGYAGNPLGRTGIQAYAAEDFTSTAGGTNLILTTVSNGTTTSSTRMTISENGNIGMGTSTPQKKLHVSGDIQVTGEINVGGTGATNGSAGTSGQALISQGIGLPPVWQTLNIPTADVNSFKLKGVYSVSLLDIAAGANGQFVTLGSLNGVKVNGPNNFIIVEFQSTGSAISISSSQAISYRYQLVSNNSLPTINSPYFYLVGNGFSPRNNLSSYKFFLSNVPPNTYNFTINAAKANTTGTDSDRIVLYFNRTYSTIDSFEKSGNAIVYVYEK